MARTIGMELLEQKIQKAQEDVFKTKKKYDASTAVLKKFLDKRQSLRMEEVMAALLKSSRTYEDIMNYINTDSNEEPEEE